MVTKLTKYFNVLNHFFLSNVNDGVWSSPPPLTVATVFFTGFPDGFTLKTEVYECDVYTLLPSPLDIFTTVY